MQQPITQQSSSSQDWVLFQILAAVLSGGTSQALIITTEQQHTAQLDQIRSDLRQVLSNQQSPSDNSAKLDQILAALERIEEKLMSLESQVTDLQAAVADVKAASDEEAVRVEAIIAALQAGGGDNPAVAQAITDLKGTAAALRAFHATPTDTPPGLRSRK